MSRSIIVGISDCGISGEPGAQLVTYALGSCVAVAVYDPVARIGGLLHYMLPLSVMHPRGTEQKPWMYCDSGLPLMLDRLCKSGAVRSRMVAQAAGGAQVVDDRGLFNIGRKNEQILRQILEAWKLPLVAEELGGTVSRTVGLDLDTGRFWIKEWRLNAATGRHHAERRAVGR